MKPIDDLVQEHGSIKLMLRILEKINEKISTGESVPTEDLNNVIIFLKEFADKCHHGKEESLLFPMMQNNKIKEEVELIDVLLAEHVMGRSYIKNMVIAIERKGEGQNDYSKMFLENSQKYITLLDHHIDKENQILFLEAEKSLSADQFKELEDGFENVEKNTIGEERHQYLLTLAGDLRKKYL